MSSSSSTWAAEPFTSAASDGTARVPRPTMRLDPDPASSPSSSAVTLRPAPPPPRAGGRGEGVGDGIAGARLDTGGEPLLAHAHAPLGQQADDARRHVTT